MAENGLTLLGISRSSVNQAISRFSRRFSASWSMMFAFDAGSPYIFIHLNNESVLTPIRYETSRTGYRPL